MKLHLRVLGLLAGAVIALAPTAALAEGMIQIKGSDTMLNLGQAWAEAFMKKNPSVMLAVTGGGSGTGIAAFLNGTCDICQASRIMSGKEISQARDKNITPVKTVVALDGISIAVHSSNPVHSLTIEQLKDIYTGKVRNWRQVGGKDAPIFVMSRESSSGTYVYMKEHVLKNNEYAQSCLLMPSTKAIQQELSSNVNGIGYGGVAYFKNEKNIKIIAVAEKRGAPSIEPTDTNVRSGKYPISRPLMVYTRGKATGQVGNYIKFCLSPEGQKIVEQVGYVSLH